MWWYDNLQITFEKVIIWLQNGYCIKTILLTLNNIYSMHCSSILNMLFYSCKIFLMLATIFKLYFIKKQDSGKVNKLWHKVIQNKHNQTIWQPLQKMLQKLSYCCKIVAESNYCITIKSQFLYIEMAFKNVILVLQNVVEMCNYFHLYK